MFFCKHDPCFPFFIQATDAELDVQPAPIEAADGDTDIDVDVTLSLDDTMECRCQFNP